LKVEKFVRTYFGILCRGLKRGALFNGAPLN
jgi:hypothetical protein